jgi:hypothetical protein
LTVSVGAANAALPTEMVAARTDPSLMTPAFFARRCVILTRRRRTTVSLPRPPFRLAAFGVAIAVATAKVTRAATIADERHARPRLEATDGHGLSRLAEGSNEEKCRQKLMFHGNDLL